MYDETGDGVIGGHFFVSNSRERKKVGEKKHRRTLENEESPHIFLRIVILHNRKQTNILETKPINNVPFICNFLAAAQHFFFAIFLLLVLRGTFG